MIQRFIKSSTIVLALSLFTMVFTCNIANAQDVLKILASDTFIGTFNGALLGGGTMALANNSDLTPMRYGVGFGTLYGLGVGAIDLTDAQKNSPYTVHGVLNNADYSTQIVLLDTFYGGATGSIIGMAISLIANKSVVKGLQYGSGAGVWAGFGFGLIDSFYLSKTGYRFKKDSFSNTVSNSTTDNSGFVQIQTSKSSTLSLLSPMTLSTLQKTSYGYKMNYHMGLQVAQLNIAF